MITIHHNFDSSKFMWLWAKYVRAGNIEKHCTASMIGAYSKKFSGSSNPQMSEQTTLIMNEVPESEYEAIYFCGVLKKGYLQKDPRLNNYPHNVHFAVRPQQGAKDTYRFENWQVDIENGVLERIPETFELSEKFFHEPYTSHYYTCRIFRWMVGHFYPEMLQKVPESGGFDQVRLFGFEKAREYFESAIGSDSPFEYWTQMMEVAKKDGYLMLNDAALKKYVFKNNLFDRRAFARLVPQHVSFAIPKQRDYFAIGVEDYMERLFPYQERKFISL